MGFRIQQADRRCQRFLACFFAGLAVLCGVGFAAFGFACGTTFFGFAGVTFVAAFFTGAFFAGGLGAGLAAAFFVGALA